MSVQLLLRQFHGEAGREKLKLRDHMVFTCECHPVDDEAFSSAIEIVESQREAGKSWENPKMNYRPSLNNFRVALQRRDDAHKWIPLWRGHFLEGYTPALLLHAFR